MLPTVKPPATQLKTLKTQGAAAVNVQIERSRPTLQEDANVARQTAGLQRKPKRCFGSHGELRSRAVEDQTISALALDAAEFFFSA